MPKRYFLLQNEIHGKALSACCQHDENFNTKTSVAIECKIAEQIMNNPSVELIDAIQKISNKLYTAIDFLYLIFAKDTTKIYLEAMFCPIKDPTVSGIAHDNFHSFKTYKDAIKNQLQEPVTENNLLRHLQILFALAHLIISHTISNEAQEPLTEQVSSELLHTIYAKQHENQTELEHTSVHHKMQKLFNDIFPEKECMQNIRFKRNRFANADKFTTTKGLQPRSQFVAYSCDNVSYSRGIDVWRIKQHLETNKFIQNAKTKKLPLVCGASGSTARALVLLHLLSVNEDKQLTARIGAGIAAFMAYCGHHSLHEVGCVLRKAGLPYEDGNYATIIPNEILAEDIISDIVSSTFQVRNRRHSI